MAKFSMTCKESMVKEISRRLSGKDTFIITNYRGLSAKDMNELRKELRRISGEYLVVKDSMVKRALAESPAKSAAEFIEGEVGIAIDNKNDATDISKILVKFAKDHKVMAIRGGIMSGTIISKEEIAQLSKLPSREELLGKLANVLNAPIQSLAGVLNAIITKFCYALNAVKDKKEASREAAGEKKEEPAAPDSDAAEKAGQPEEQTKEQTQAPADQPKEQPQEEKSAEDGSAHGGKPEAAETKPEDIKKPEDAPKPETGDQEQ